MTKKITFIGFIGEGFGDFLNEFYKHLALKEINLEAIQLGSHKNAFENTLNPNFSILKYDNIWGYESIKSNIEALIQISDADFYLIWNGYHDFYARIRSLLEKNSRPYLLCEYSSIKHAYLFDSGLHGECTTNFIKESTSKDFEVKSLEKIITSKYTATNNSLKLLENKLKDYSTPKKLLLLLGIWEDASGFNSYNNKSIQNNLSPVYKTNSQTVEDILSVMPADWILIFKPHPAVQESKSTEALKEKIAQTEKVLWLNNDIPLLELMKRSDAIATITSTTSILATFLEKPLLMIGNSYVNQSSYSYNLSDYKTLKEAITDLTNKTNWSKRQSQRTLFFESYIKADFLYSHIDILNFKGVKTVELLAHKITDTLNSNLKKEISFSEQKGMHLIESCLFELSNTQKWLQEKENQLLEKNIIIQKNDSKLFELKNTLNKFNIIFKKITWYSSLNKMWRRSLRTFKRELENQLNS